MSLLYKQEKDIIYKVEIKEREKDSDDIKLSFSSDCGKFGTEESLDFYKLTPLELLDLLQNYYEKQ